MIHKACSLHDRPALVKHSEVRNSSNVEACGKIRIALRVDLEDDGPARHIRRHACDLGRRHAAGAAPFCPEVYEHRNSRVTHDFVELLGIDLRRLIDGREHSLTRPAPARIRKVLCRHTVLSLTRLARPHNAYNAPLSPLQLRAGWPAVFIGRLTTES